MRIGGYYLERRSLAAIVAALLIIAALGYGSYSLALGSSAAKVKQPSAAMMRERATSGRLRVRFYRQYCVVKKSHRLCAFSPEAGVRFAVAPSSGLASTRKASAQRRPAVRFYRTRAGGQLAIKLGVGGYLLSVFPHASRRPSLTRTVIVTPHATVQLAIDMTHNRLLPQLSSP